MIVILLFFCSGATALVYEVVWSKYLSLLLGSSVQAQTVVLASFMGGLALGNRLFGGRADRAASPLALYGWLEVSVGLYAFAFDPLYGAADWVFLGVASGLSGTAGALLLVKALLGAGLLLGPTILMGGTLPLLAAWLQRRYPDAGRWSARFYAVNSLGAVAGSAFAGFVLVRQLGLVSSLQMTALLNVIIGFTAIGIARSMARAAAEAPAAEAKPVAEAAPAASRGALRTACLLVAVTGGVSMGLEVLASRSLVLIVGASLQAFALVLIAFILGIGVGGSVVASPRFRRVHWGNVCTALLLIAALWVGALVSGIEQWVDVYRQLKTGLGRTEMGYSFHQLLIGLLSLVVLGVPAALIGAVLPVSIRALDDGSGSLGRQVGRLLTWNTLGAVGGSLATGFLLMPWLGLRGAFFALTLLLSVAAGILAATQQRRRALAAAVATGAVLLFLGQSTGEGWRLVLSSGVFRLRETTVNPDTLRLRKARTALVFYEDAADATVSVEHERVGGGTGTNVVLRVNGKPDASTGLDLATQYMVAHLPLLSRPGSTNIFVLGLGSGATAGAVLRHPVQRVVVAENCGPVVRAARFFESINAGVLTDPRVQIVPDDGRTVLKLARTPFDVIISEPSNPWMVGVGSVFSQEFYELCKSRLKEDGLMVQWFHLYEMDDTIVALVLRTFASVYPHMEVWDVNLGDVILLGATRPWATGAPVFEQAFQNPGIRAQLELIGLKNPAALWARQIASQRTAFATGGDGPVQSDRFPLLEYDAPRAFFMGAESGMLVRFDERLHQGALAPEEKRAALARLTAADLVDVFDRYQPALRDFREHLQAYHLPNATQTNQTHPHPCLFRPEAWPATPVRLPDPVSPELRALLEAEGQIRKEGPDWRTGVQTILVALQEPEARGLKSSNPPEFSSSHFARTAALAALGQGDAELARAILDRARQLDPASEQLRYLERIRMRMAGEDGPGSSARR